MVLLHRAHSDVLAIDSSLFNKGKTWTLLVHIVNDAQRQGVPCGNGRTLRTLKEGLKLKANQFAKPEYGKVANSLKWKDGLAWTTLPVGTVIILSKTQKKNSATEVSRI
jgi:hypothetical protein